MRIAKLFFMLAFAIGMNSAFADSLFFDDEAIQDGLPVFEMSKNFADVYEKLNTVKWGGKNLNVAIESLENLNPSAHIAATDERVVLVWDDKIIWSWIIRNNLIIPYQNNTFVCCSNMCRWI